MEVIRGGDFVNEISRREYLHSGWGAWVACNPGRWNRASLFALAATLVGALAPIDFAVTCFAQESSAPDTAAQRDARTGTVLHQLEILSDRPTTSEPPAVEILDPNPTDLIELSKPQLQLTYRIRSSLGPTKIALFVDGGRVLLDDSQQPHRSEDEHEFINHVTFNIPEHDVLIAIAAENALGSGKRAQLHVRWVGSDAPKPNLYVLSIGVKDYKDPEIQQKYPLQFPVLDATEFAKTMKAQEGRLYKKVDVRILPDAAAHRTAILQGLIWLRTNATNKDVAMVFMSGHGVSRGGAGYDYLPFEADKSEQDLTYIHDFELRDYLKRITAKIVAFIDTCHSGNFFGVPGSKDIPNPYLRNFAEDLAKSSSFTVVFASSTGEELSIEREEWGHGAFTKALIEGLDGGAANERGMISIARLNDYIAERVKELTEGKQHPMYISPSGNTNPAIAAKAAIKPH
jgi:hypothetical protein